jgi:hypothetical protein
MKALLGLHIGATKPLRCRLLGDKSLGSYRQSGSIERVASPRSVINYEELYDLLYQV